MAKMLRTGEDPRFIFRRMLILCSEDIGLADPNAIVVVNSLAEAFERVGMPEGNYSWLTPACTARLPRKATRRARYSRRFHTWKKSGRGRFPSIYATRQATPR